MLNIVIPMAGRGQRFAQCGYTLPKPLIPIHGIPMIQVVIENIRPSMPHKFTFICQHEHTQRYGLANKLRSWAQGCNVIEIDRVTEGAACTVLLARDLINTKHPLMIANCDQYIDVDINDYLATIDKEQLDGLIMTMEANDPKWSFVGFNASGQIERVVEKQPISDQATVGIYNYRRGSDFVSAAEEMIKANDRVNNEFYVAPAYNRMISRGAKLGVYSIGAEGHGMYGLGTPEDLQIFERLEVSYRATKLRNCA
jgi:dTDP-glucose pyrophosphorylase